MSSPTYEKGREKREGEGKICQEVLDLIFRERVSSFSLSLCAIRSLAVFGARRKAALREKGFAWVLDLRSLDKLLEVGVSPYLGLFFV